MSGHPCIERLLLPEALAGRLEPSEERRVMAHLEGCPACQDAAADIEIALISLAVVRDEREHPETAPAPGPARVAGSAVPSGATATFPEYQPGPSEPAPQSEPGRIAEPVPISRKWRWSTRALAAAAAVLLIAGGALVGRQLLPPRDPVTFGPTQALAPPATAADQSARGSVALADQDGTVVVRLDATSLPRTGWFECVWVAQGQTRSAGSFKAVGGEARNVRLRVAAPQDPTAWDLQIVHHLGPATDVVLEGMANYHL